MRQSTRLFIPALHWAVCLTTLCSIQACAAGAAGGGGSGSGNVITREMIGDPGNQNAYTIVERHRPRWLSPRTQATIANPQPAFAEVYLDDVHFGPIDALYRIDATEIDRI